MKPKGLHLDLWIPFEENGIPILEATTYGWPEMNKGMKDADNLHIACSIKALIFKLVENPYPPLEKPLFVLTTPVNINPNNN